MYLDRQEQQEFPEVIIGKQHAVYVLSDPGYTKLFIWQYQGTFMDINLSIRRPR